MSKGTIDIPFGSVFSQLYFRPIEALIDMLKLIELKTIIMQMKTSAIASLLTQAVEAHHDYEQTVLKGVYDQDWANWYAEYVIQNGLSELLEQEITVQQVSQFFTQNYEAYKGKNSGESWVDYTAKEMQQIRFV